MVFRPGWDTATERRGPRKAVTAAGRSGCVVPALELAKEPGPGEGPVAFGGRFGDAEAGSGLRQAQAREEPELDEFGVLRVGHRQSVQGGAEGVDGFRGFRARLGDGFEFREFDAKPATAMAGGPFAAGVVDQDFAHGPCGDGVEVGLTVPVAAPTSRDLEPSLVDQSGGLEGLAGRFGGQFVGGESTELVVDLGQKSGGVDGG